MKFAFELVGTASASVLPRSQRSPAPVPTLSSSSNFLCPAIGMSLPSFPSFELQQDGNIGPRWEKWLARLKRLLIGMNIQDPVRQHALMLNYAGPDVDEIYDTLTIPSPGDGETIFDVACQALTNYFTPKTNTVFEVYTFRQCCQHPQEPIDSCVTRLRKLAKSCGFTDMDTEIANQIVLACSSQTLRRRALRQDLTLDHLIAAARALELSDKQADTVESSAKTTTNTVAQHQTHRGRGRYRARGGRQQRQRSEQSSSRGRHGKPPPPNNCNSCYICGNNTRHHKNDPH